MQIIFDLEGTLLDGAARAIFPGVIDLLKTLQEKEITLYLWTGAQSSVRPLLVRQGLASYFRDFCFCDIKYPKPDSRGPDDLLDFDKSGDLFVIGDTRNDLKGANNLGATFIAACWSDADIETRLKSLGAEKFAHSPMRVLDFL